MTLQTLGVIGAGTMGHGIAQVAVLAGFEVVMIDVAEAALARGQAAVAASLERAVQKGRLDADARDAALARLRTASTVEALAPCGLVIEAATENLELKLRILRQAEAAVAPEAVLATNTSSISISQLAAVMQRPERFIGLHFFNPVPVMALVEVIRGLQTGDAAQALALEVAARLGKTAVTVRNAPGFVVNRILVPMINEAFFVLQEGVATAEDIDAGMRLGCNHPIGPLALADLIGLDTVLAIMNVLHADFGDPKYRPATRLRELVAAGHLGRKSGQGVYPHRG